jgi:hypothetical protein
VLRAFGFARLDSLRSQEIDPHSNKKGIVGNRWQAVADMLFTMQSWPQLVATVRNGSQVVERVLRPSPLPAVAVGCVRSAPQVLHDLTFDRCRHVLPSNRV